MVEQNDEWMREWHERNRILGLAIDSGATEFGPNTWNISFTSESWTKFLTGLMRSPQETQND